MSEDRTVYFGGFTAHLAVVALLSISLSLFILRADISRIADALDRAHPKEASEK